MIEKFKAFIEKERLFHKNDRVLLAVSGGADSIVLAHLFKASGFNAAIAHCNFKLRDEDADADQEFVKKIAEELSFPFYVTHFDTKQYAQKHKLSIQSAARALRYEWLEEIRSKENLMWIATAHHLDDSIETFFLNALRGTGLSGLRGIPEKNNKVVRPLLFATKDEILHFIESNQITYREDDSNLSDDYQRNKIRHSLIPVIKKLNPEYQKVFSANFEKLKGDELLRDREISNWQKKNVQRLHTGDDLIAKSNLTKLNTALPYLNGYLKEYGFNTQQVKEILDNIDIQSGKQFLSETHRLVVDRKHLILSKKNAENTLIKVIEKEDTIVDYDNYTYHFSVITQNDFSPNTDNQTAYFNYNKIHFPLMLRKWKKGDYFYPFGMKLKKKKLSDFFTDLKLSLPEKEKVDILTSDKKIAWVAGLRSDERFRVNKGTKKILKIERREK